jgi:hypothetical protein
MSLRTCELLICALVTGLMMTRPWRRSVAGLGVGNCDCGDGDMKLDVEMEMEMETETNACCVGFFFFRILPSTDSLLVSLGFYMILLIEGLARDGYIRWSCILPRDKKSLDSLRGFGYYDIPLVFFLGCISV